MIVMGVRCGSGGFGSNDFGGDAANDSGEVVVTSVDDDHK